MTQGGRKARSIGAASLLAASIVTLAIVGPGALDRVTHPARYATSGRALLPPGAYLAAARRRVGADARIAGLALPLGDAPVIVSVWPSTGVYLDPPTGRVLDVARATGEHGPAPIAGAQPIASVVARARPYTSGSLRGIDWPTERSPDWTVRFGDAGAAVKVADDSGTARAAPMRRPSGATALVARLPDLDASHDATRFAIVLGAIATAIVAVITLVGSTGRRRKTAR